MLDKIFGELPGRACVHKRTVTTRNHGLEREVCETCGHVMIRLLDAQVDESEKIGTVQQQGD